MKIILCDIDSRKTEINISKDTTIGEVIEKYAKIKGGMVGNYQIKFMGLVCHNSDLISDYDIEDGDELRINEKNYGGGFAPIKLNADISKNNTEFIPSKPAPSWRQCFQGINIIGYCTNNNCSRNKDNNEVVCPLKNIKHFEMCSDQGKNLLRCPSCSQRIEASNFGFVKCDYSISYKLVTHDDEIKKGEIKGSARGQGIKKFIDEDGGIKTDYLKLDIDVVYI